MQEILKLVLLIVFDIPAIFVSIIIFIYFITHPLARSKPKNRVWLILLLVMFTQLTIYFPMSMCFYYLGEVWPATDAYCVWWNWYEYTTTAIGSTLMAWASIERHFFIFYPTLILGAPWRKWVFHLVPIILCILWPIVWYLVLIVISPMCTNVWDFTSVVCGGLPCYYITVGDGTYGILDTIFSIVVPLGLIILANMALIIRVIYQKISRGQVIHWGRHRKMVFQLWCISSLYLAVWLPAAITLFIRLIALPNFLDDQLANLIFVVNFVPLLLPFVCLGVFPEIMNSIRVVLGRQRGNQVATVSVSLQARTRTRPWL